MIDSKATKFVIFKLKNQEKKTKTIVIFLPLKKSKDN